MSSQIIQEINTRLTGEFPLIAIRKAQNVCGAGLLQAGPRLKQEGSSIAFADNISAAN